MKGQPTLVAILFGALLSTALANPLPSHNYNQAANKNYTFAEIPTTKELVWYSCEKIYYCARLQVPLDYKKPNGLKASVPLIKLPANTSCTDGPYKGTILVNPGGPGQSGIVTILDIGIQIQQNITGSNYDLIGFDPRGIGYSLPSATCLPPGFGQRRRKRGTTSLKPLDAPLLPFSELEDFYDVGDELAAVCVPVIGSYNESGPHMTTAVVARDMLSIIDAVEGCDGKALLNYMGFSYGTFIGETFASMFPDRVGRIALDGVIDPEDWITGTNKHESIHMDADIATLFEDCFVAGPAKCSFFTGTSAADIQTRLNKIFAQLDLTNAEKAGKNLTIIVDALSTLKGTLKSAAYTPLTWFPHVSDQLVAYEAVLANETLSLDTIAAIASNVPPPTADDVEHLDWTAGNLCSDQALYGKNISAAEFTYLSKQSTVGVDTVLSLQAVCTRWPIKGEWRYTGPFGGKTKNKILFVSNTLDPVTPVENGIEGAKIYMDAQLVIAHGTGHTSLANPNKCTQAHVKTYFQSGSLSSNLKYCKREVRSFQ